jgi:predicted nucleotidyltransferase
MATEFDWKAAKKFLKEREEKQKSEQEEIRKDLLQRVISILKEEFKHTDVQVYLVGSILRPNRFTQASDVDIVVNNFKGDRFALWASLEEKIGRNVEVILFESCHFKEFIISEGLQVR